MIWKPMKILQAVKTSDILHNEVETGEFITLAETKGRFSPYTAEDVTISGREMTQNTQRYLVPVAYETIRAGSHVDFDGHIVKIIQITDNAPRWSVLQVEAVRA